MFQDLRFAARYLTRRPVVAIVAVAMTALGIGATTAMFSIVDGVLLRALPYPSAGRLVTIWETYPHWRGRPVLDAQWDRIALSYSEYLQVAALDRSFESTGAAYWRQDVRLRGAGDAVDVTVARGSASLLPLLGVRPQLGRWFLPGEEGSGAPLLAVLPHTLWMSRFGGDANVLGRSIELEGRPFVVIGVLPASFRFSSVSVFAAPEDRDAIWTPIGSWSGDLQEHSQNFEVVGRLRPGVPLEPTREAVARVTRGDRNPAQHDARLLPRLDAETSSVRTSLVALFAAVGLLLLIACGNLAALLLGEAAGREPEVRLRLALGATPSRVVRQLLTESTLLSIAGAAMGMPIAMGLTRALLRLAPFELPRAESVGLDWRALAFTIATAFAASLAYGLAPALSLRHTGLDPRPAGHRSATIRRRLTQHALIASQISLSMVLLVAAGLLFRTLAIERSVAVGFDAQRLLTVSLNASSRDRSDPGAAARFYDAAVERIQTLPGVAAVTATSNVPIAGRGGQWAISIDPAVKLSLTSPNAQHDEVRPDFFTTMRIPLLAGRGLDDRDRAGGTLVAVVNETMARQFWPRESAIGRQFLAPNGGVRTIVGIVADVRERGLGHTVVPTFYQSVRQVPASQQTLLIRTSVDPRELAESVRKAVSYLEPALAIGTVETMEGIIDGSLAPERFRLLLVGFFGVMAMAMTLVGIFGVAMRTVTSQMRELCVRQALGATPGSVIALVVGRYLRVALAGLLGGVIAATAAMRLVEAYLVGVTARDPVTYVTVATLLLGLVALAGWLPARRLRDVCIAQHVSGE